MVIPSFVFGCDSWSYLLWHDAFHEFLGLVNDKAPSMGLPRNHVCRAINFNLIEHLMELERKRGSDSTPTALACRSNHVVHGLRGKIMIIMYHKVSRVKFGSQTGGNMSTTTARRRRRRRRGSRPFWRQRHDDDNECDKVLMLWKRRKSLLVESS